MTTALYVCMRKTSRDGLVPDDGAAVHADELRGKANLLVGALAVVFAGCPSSSSVSSDAGPLADPAADAGVAQVDARVIAADAAVADAPPDGAPPPPGRVLYPEGVLHSPVTGDTVADIATVTGAASSNASMFAKVGDSITATDNFLSCYASAPIAGFDTSAFQRWSEAARSGWTTADVLAGSPSPLDMEISAIAPRYAVVMLGTNDLRLDRSLDAYGSDLWTIVDRLRSRGVVPILSTIPALPQDSTRNARIPLRNRVVRAIAQGRSALLVDYHLAMDPLPNDGIGADGIHPSISPQGPCAGGNQDLSYGYNMRNLVVTQALDRARLAASGTALDQSVTRREGQGTLADPFVGTLPLVDMGDTRKGDTSFVAYTPCGLSATGHEIVYRIDLSQRQTLGAYVVDHDGVDVEVAILSAAAASSCVAAGASAATATVGPGAVYVVVDSRTPVNEGEFVLVVQ